MAAALPLPARAGWLTDNLVDPSDGQLDASKWLAQKRGFLPVPIFITEPAVGPGLGVALLYFHDRFAAEGEGASPFDPAPPSESGRRHNPSISGVVGAATNNDSWLVGGFHMGNWRDDSVRYLGALAPLSLNLKFFGLDGGDGAIGNEPLKFKLDSTFLLQQVLFRIGDSDVFLGGKYIFMDNSASFRIGQPPPDVPDFREETRSAGLGLLAEYDSRDNTFTPTRGISASLESTFYREAVGSDDDFEKYRAFVKGYHPLTQSFFLGLRGEWARLDGIAPFYEYPFVELRGVRALRYQGETTVVGEAELRWRFSGRWSAVVFGGLGKAFAIDALGGDSGTVVTKGVGVRYLLARRFGMHVGADVARGPDETAFYIQVGHAWAR